MQTATNLDEVCEAHLATLLSKTAGIAARLRARGEQVAFLGCWIPCRQKRKTGRKRS
ncbi:hypothetical protein ACNKHT_03370 [Shigella flexneri]